MATEKKACETMETAASEVQEGKEKTPHMPQLLGRKLLRVANRELAG